MATKGCSHEDQIRDAPPRAEGCEECLAQGGRWVELRRCLVCGHVGCCDSSPHRHARAHFEATHHPVIQTFEPGEAWRWCYVDEVYLPDGRELSHEDLRRHHPQQP